MSTFTIIIQYCLAVAANAIRQGKEIRGINIGDKVKTFLFADKNQIKDYQHNKKKTVRIRKRTRKVGSYK